uniref:Uncharacterized protein n=1 Tax=Triticum urartu TaxID=4572 RepID=A0A8R7V313_TRIUA
MVEANHHGRVSLCASRGGRRGRRGTSRIVIYHYDEAMKLHLRAKARCNTCLFPRTACWIFLATFCC